MEKIQSRLTGQKRLCKCDRQRSFILIQIEMQHQQEISSAQAYIPGIQIESILSPQSPRNKSKTAPPKVFDVEESCQNIITEAQRDPSSKPGCSLRLKIGIIIAVFSCVVIALLIWTLVSLYELKVEVHQRPIMSVSDDNSTVVGFAEYRVKQRGFMGREGTDLNMTVMEVYQKGESSDSEQDQTDSGTRLLQSEAQRKEVKELVHQLMRHHAFNDKQKGFSVIVSEKNGKYHAKLVIDLQQLGRYLELQQKSKGEDQEQEEDQMSQAELVSMFTELFRKAIEEEAKGLFKDIQFKYIGAPQNSSNATANEKRPNQPRNLHWHWHHWWHHIRHQQHHVMHKIERFVHHVVRKIVHVVRVIANDAPKIGEAIGTVYGVWSAVREGKWFDIIKMAREDAHRGELVGQFIKQLVNECVPQGTTKVDCSMDALKSIYGQYRNGIQKYYQNKATDRLIGEGLALLQPI